MYKILQLFLLTKSAFEPLHIPITPMIHWRHYCLIALLMCCCLYFMGREKASFGLILGIRVHTCLCVIALNRPPCVKKTIRMARPRITNFMKVLEKFFMLLSFLEVFLNMKTGYMYILKLNKFNKFSVSHHFH